MEGPMPYLSCLYIFDATLIGTRISLFVFEITRPSRWPYSILLWLEAQSYWVQILVGSDVSHRGCAYTVLQTVQRHGVCSDVYGTVNYKEPLKLFDKTRAYSLPFFTILPWLCRKQRKAIFTWNNDTCIDDRYFVVWFSWVGLCPKTSIGHIYKRVISIYEWCMHLRVL